MKFSDLKVGLHSPPTRIKLATRERYMDSDWVGFVIHEVHYVNKSDREVVYQAFSQIGVMTEEQFNTRGYMKDEKAN